MNKVLLGITLAGLFMIGACKNSSSTSNNESSNEVVEEQPPPRSPSDGAILNAEQGMMVLEELNEKEREDLLKLKNMKDEILAMAKDKSCEEFSACKSIGLGSKPCGGHWTYLTYSSANLDETVLKEQVQTYNELEASLNKKYGYSSNCLLVTPPTLSCTENRCTVVE